MIGKSMETPAITPPTAVSRSSFDVSNTSSFFSHAAAGKNEEEDHCQHIASSADSEMENDSLMRSVMEQYRQHILEKEHAALTKKVEELSFQSKMSKIFSCNSRK
jgi:hypothetical protein